VRIKDVTAPPRLFAPARGSALLVFGICVLALNLRAAITSLPPVFPELESALHISASSLALLAAIPVLCFGVFSGSAAPLSRRLGEERVLWAALLLLAAGLLLRGLSPSTLLFPGTIVAGAGIALMNVLLPSLIKRRMPERAGLLIGLYLLMLATGAIAASLIAIPVYTAAGGLAHGGTTDGSAAIRITLALWAGPALLAGLIWAPQLRLRTMPEGRKVAPGGPAAAGAVASGPVTSGPVASGPVASGPVASGPVASGPVASGPVASGPVTSGPASVALAGGRGRQGGALAMGRSMLAWQVTLFMGLQSLSYYATLSWFPTMFRDRGVSAVHAGDLLALMNLGNAVTALLIPVLAHRAADQRRLAAWSMLATSAGLAGAVFGAAALAPGFIVVLGLGQGATLGLGIFYTMARAPDPRTAASLSAFAQGIGYLIASAGPLTIGFLHDATGGWTVPGLVLLVVAALQLLTGWLAGRARTVPAAA
jgi:MFS transporter, CP family, cyanate transporter